MPHYHECDGGYYTLKLFLDCTKRSQSEIQAILSNDDLVKHLSGLYISKKKFNNLFSQSSSLLPDDIPLEIIVRDKTSLYDEKNELKGQAFVIERPNDMQTLMDAEINESMQYLLVETTSWHVIPLENLIAKFNGKPTELLAVARTLDEVQLLTSVLELGVDGCILEVGSLSEIEDIVSTITGMNRLTVPLQEFTVTHTKRIGSGVRACVDTCDLLSEGEGLLVGGTAALFLLVEAEVAESGFVNARPFRVNAGTISSYVLGKDKTNYLSELKAGSKVLIVDRRGNARVEIVGRVKIERRPLIIINVEHEGRDFHVILQEAETVKLVTTDGSIRVDELKAGDKILGHVSDVGRHFGMSVNEFLEER